MNTKPRPDYDEVDYDEAFAKGLREILLKRIRQEKAAGNLFSADFWFDFSKVCFTLEEANQEDHVVTDAILALARFAQKYLKN